MTAAQQDVVTQETQVLQQELILKSVLTRSGFDNPAVVAARIIPTDHVDVPAQDPVIPLQDLVAEAMKNRPEIESTQISLENARLNMLGTKNNLLPTLSRQPWRPAIADKRARSPPETSCRSTVPMVRSSDSVRSPQPT